MNQQQLKEVLHYDPLTGSFTWLYRSAKTFKNKESMARWNSRHIGSNPGGIDKDGYHCIRVFDTLYRAHRLAYLYMTGDFPAGEIDHIDHVKNNNKWDNLRNVSRVENAKNTTMRTNNTVGVVGVYWDKRRGKWTSQIGVNKGTVNLGRYGSLLDAVAVRKAAEVKYKFHSNHGEIPNV